MHAPFGKRTTEQDLHHRHLAGAPLHSEGAGAQQCAPATRRFRIQRKRKQGTNKDYVYTFIGQRPIRSLKAKIRALTHRTSQRELGFVLVRLNLVMHGWANYFKHAVAKNIFSMLDNFAWWRIIRMLRVRHHWRWNDVRRRFIDRTGRWHG